MKSMSKQHLREKAFGAALKKGPMKHYDAKTKQSTNGVPERTSRTVASKKEMC